MKSSWTCCASTDGRTLRLALAAGVLALALAAPGSALKKPVDPEELFNPLLGVEYSHWLTGPIYEMATDDEVERFHRLTSDQEAAAFVEAFWERRSQGTQVFKKTPRQIFEERAQTADSRYAEGTLPGRLTDRGTVYILFGEPEETTFESSRLRDGPPVEVWEYGKDAGEGLNGEKPRKQFRFMEIDGSTIFFNSGLSEREARKRGRTRIRNF